MTSTTSYNADFFARLWQIEDKHFWFKTRNQVIVELVKRIVSNLPSGYRVLEVGCGTGNVLRHLERVCTRGRVLGLDLLLEGLQFARRRVSCPLVQADIHQPPFKGQFDLIGIFDVLEHLPDDRLVLRVLHSLLKPDGYLLITVPAHMVLWSYSDEAAHHRRRYQKQELCQKLTESGFEVTFLTHYMASIFPLIWLGRRLIGRRQAHTHVLARCELRVVPIFNRLLTAILLLEARLVGAWKSLPFGASLLAVAHKRTT